MSLLTSLTRMWLTRSTRPFHFTDESDPILDYADAPNLGLYVHIPFCRTLCDFCPYCKTVYQEDTAAAYIDALKKEIALAGNGNERRKVTTLYFGGGSPALVANRIGEIIETLRQYFDITEGIGLELHPADVTTETLRALKAAGVTRISIGIQSFGEEYLALLGRREHDYGAMFAALKEVPFDTVAMDFIFALPNQTSKPSKKTSTQPLRAAPTILRYIRLSISLTPAALLIKCPRRTKKICCMRSMPIAPKRAMCGIPYGPMPC